MQTQEIYDLHLSQKQDIIEELKSQRINNKENQLNYIKG
jgi:hypothetical protein